MEGWRLIFCSLASASGRPHTSRAAQLRVERDHPSSCPPFHSPVPSTPSSLPHLSAIPCARVVSDLVADSLGFAISTTMTTTTALQSVRAIAMTSCSLRENLFINLRA